jgi:hypothetical protein
VKEERSEAMNEPYRPSPRAGGFIFLLKNELLACGWVLTYAIILSVFELVRQMESILQGKAENKSSLPAKAALR